MFGASIEVLELLAQRTAKLLDAGAVSSAHVDVMARAARHREACFDEHEEALLDAARALPVQHFRHVARRWRVLADDVLADKEAPRSFQQRYLQCSVTFQGRARIDGMPDPEGGARVITALESLMECNGFRCAAAGGRARAAGFRGTAHDHSRRDHRCGRSRRPDARRSDPGA